MRHGGQVPRDRLGGVHPLLPDTGIAEACVHGVADIGVEAHVEVVLLPGVAADDPDKGAVPGGAGQVLDLSRCGVGDPEGGAIVIVVRGDRDRSARVREVQHVVAPRADAPAAPVAVGLDAGLELLHDVRGLRLQGVGAAGAVGGEVGPHRLHTVVIGHRDLVLAAEKPAEAGQVGGVGHDIAGVDGGALRHQHVPVQEVDGVVEDRHPHVLADVVLCVLILVSHGRRVTVLTDQDQGTIAGADEIVVAAHLGVGEAVVVGVVLRAANLGQGRARCKALHNIRDEVDLLAAFPLGADVRRLLAHPL